jgi:hypothetical protein
MVSAGGGGGPSMPMSGNPIEMLIVLTVLAAVAWVAYKLLS